MDQLQQHNGSLVKRWSVMIALFSPLWIPASALLVIYAFAYWPDTEFAEGFSYISFAKIQPGQTEEEALQLLGPPLMTRQISTSPNVERWSYSQASQYGNYIKFEVIVNADSHKVLDRRWEYYFD